MKVAIRKATVKDAKAMAILDQACFTLPWSKEAFRREFDDNNMAFYLVAVVSESIIGYVGLWWIMGEGHITNFAVHPEYRRQGIGERLLAQLIKISKEKGIDKHTLEVRASNEAAINLYKKFEFKISGIRKEYYSDNLEDALILWRDSC